MKYGLGENQLSEIVDIFRKYPEVEEAILFGSRAIGTYKEASDIDIALKGKDVSVILATKIESDLEDTYLPFFFDIISFPSITNQDLIKHINTKGIPIYRAGWKKCKLGDVVVMHYGKALPSGKRIKGDIPVYGSAGIIGYHNEPLSKTKGLIIGRKGNIGHIYKSMEPFFAIDTTFYVQPNDDLYDMDYLYYMLQNYRFDLLNEDSAVPGLNRKTAYFQDIYLPPLHKQKEIASILSCLDDKIDLLHRQNKTLESIAQTLFHQWFIKEADENWERKPLSEIATFKNGLACQKYKPKIDTPKLPVLKIKDLKNDRLMYNDWVNSSIDESYIVNSGDVLFSWSASLIVKIWNGEKCVLNQHIFKVTSKKYPKWFFYEWCKYYLNEFILISKSHATTMGHIKKKDLENVFVVISTKENLEKMSKKMDPLLEKRINNAKEITTLENIRELILFQLIDNSNKEFNNE